MSFKGGRNLWLAPCKCDEAHNLGPRCLSNNNFSLSSSCTPRTISCRWCIVLMDQKIQNALGDSRSSQNGERTWSCRGASHDEEDATPGRHPPGDTGSSNIRVSNMTVSSSVSESWARLATCTAEDPSRNYVPVIALAGAVACSFSKMCSQ